MNEETKKYRLTEEYIQYKGRILYRIQAIKNFSDVNCGEYGGFVESEENLNQYDNSWVYDEAKVYGDARVEHAANVKESAVVFENAIIFQYAVVKGNAKIYGNAWIRESAHISGQARICDEARVAGTVKGNSVISGDVTIYGNAYIRSKGKIHTSNDYVIVENMNLDNQILTIYKARNNEIYVTNQEGYEQSLEAFMTNEKDCGVVIYEALLINGFNLK
ncbi:hypothetical protein [Candidatus Enterococcus lemimoniae]|uniref:Polymer-forming cytoskeletal protein n=1 Tax=Candidatus Enterococcus lemimoniae TaxID=1834167 RepID=A0ABZ2T5E8_9ENTE|nr:hypothetical protein [Enterococcus sp. 12C11_DIV0727]OTO69794.1 hypothetical protein A5866_002010 [Enterococcus sp. 12C11_DIV0727]